MSSLTQERLKELLHYDPETGAFVWKVNRGPLKAGAPAGTLNNGYIRIRVDKKLDYAHRLAWLYMTGESPEQHIDHRDGNRTNNKWVNLRLATLSENNRNVGLQRNNTSGAKGVTRNGKHGWMAQVVHNRQHHYLGTFRSVAEAATAALRARNALHGEFANNGGSHAHP